MFKSILRYLGLNSAEQAICPLYFGARSLRRMRRQTSQLSRR